MANTFLNAMGVAVGASLCEHDLAATALEILDRAETAGCQVLLPEDAVECEQTTRPGSILPVRVCNDKRVINARRAADQELFDNIKRNTALFASRL